MRNHRGNPGGGGAAGGVQHQQQFDQVILYRRAQRLDQEDVAFPAVGLQLNFQAVVGEPAQPYREQGLPQLRTDLGRQLGVGTSAEYRDITHADQANGPAR